jgi:small subunit ribosomal protein S20
MGRKLQGITYCGTPPGSSLIPGDTETRTAVNRSNRGRVRTSLSTLREAIAKNDVKAAQLQYRETASTLDKSVRKGIRHSNTVFRYKSRLKALATAKA